MPSSSVWLLAMSLLLCRPDGSELTISAANAGGNDGLTWWFVDIDPARRMSVAVAGAPRRTAALSDSAVDALRRAITEQAFFNLSSSYGTTCNECSVCILSVKLGTVEKRVALATTPDRASSEPERREMLRMLRIFDTVKELAGISALADACHPASQ